ncbi:MAG: PfkB family carbohydrate kinase [Flavobacteriaceae bacterium]|nr:PfkB family carbohydrate kinase [Flavobacteriaceae bacterium]
MSRSIDILSVGEILIDFIGHQKEAGTATTTDYKRYLGGSPTNVAVNMTRLGLNARLVAAIGHDGLGKFVLSEFENMKLPSDGVAVLDRYPTSVILVSRTSGTPDFLAYREADKEIYESQITDEDLKETRIFHTTCFALSKNPARATIINRAAKAATLGCKLSIDVNYAQGIWPDRSEAQGVIQQYCSFNPLVKLSEDDILRYFGREVSHEDAFDYFHQAGADWVCLTLGAKGVKLSIKGNTPIFRKALPLEQVADATGAGDAFWSGFLYAYLKKNKPQVCLHAGLTLAAIKLQNVGGLPKDINLVDLFAAET